MWLGMDDTDAPGGGCTTWVLTEVVRTASELGVDLLGYPRLVRLNPNIPWKTRGNAALAARFGHGRGTGSWAGAFGDQRIRSYSRGTALSPGEEDELFDAAWAVVERASPDVPGTDPALVAARRPLPAAVYWDAVREVVDPRATRTTLARVGARWRVRGDERGLVGAAAALAWPARHGTWETIAYRSPERLATRRTVDPTSVRAAQRAEPTLFLCHDPRTRRLLVTPHTRCPILYGLRSTDRLAGLRAQRRIRSEPAERTVVFRTNQGTGDHLVARRAGEVAPFRSAVVVGSVAATPRALPGGHVTFELSDGDGATLPCVAFEPTKTLPRVVQRLVPGDRVKVWGGRGEDPTLRLEGLRLLRVRPVFRLEPPRCATCRRRARSLGRGKGYRCPGCRTRFPPEAARRRALERGLNPGVYHPSPSARRHLAPRGPEP